MVYDCLVPQCVMRRINEPSFKRNSMQSRRFEGALLFPDVSGFTRLSEKFAAEEEAGAEKLSIVMNSYFTLMLNLIFEYNGDVIKFAGDALQVVWSFDRRENNGVTVDISLVAHCGWNLVRELDNHDTGFDHILRLKATLGGGVLVGMHVGADDRWEYCVAGEPLGDIAVVEHDATPGDFVVSRASWDAGLESSGFTGSPLPSGGMKITGFDEVQSFNLDIMGSFKQFNGIASGTDTTIDPGSSLAIEAVSAYMNGYFVNRLQSHLGGSVSEPAVLETSKGSLGGGRGADQGIARIRMVEAALQHTAELRRVTILFATLPELKAHLVPLESFQGLVAPLFKHVVKHEGQIRQFIVDDKGVVLIAVFGLPPLVHEDDAARAVKTGLAMVKTATAQGHCLGVGVTCGQAFVGGVGSGSRFEYAVMGDVVNMSARLSCKTRGEVLVSEEVGEQAKEVIELEDRPPAQMKGKLNPVTIHRAVSVRRGMKTINSFTKPRDTFLPLCGREQALVQLREALDRFHAGSEGSLIALHSAPGMGGSRMLEEAAGLCKQSDLVVLRCTALLAEKQTPYFALRPSIRAQAMALLRATRAIHCTGSGDARVDSRSSGSEAMGSSCASEDRDRDRDLDQFLPPSRYHSSRSADLDVDTSYSVRSAVTGGGTTSSPNPGGNTSPLTGGRRARVPRTSTIIPIEVLERLGLDSEKVMGSGMVSVRNVGMPSSSPIMGRPRASRAPTSTAAAAAAPTGFDGAFERPFPERHRVTEEDGEPEEDLSSEISPPSSNRPQSVLGRPRNRVGYRIYRIVATKSVIRRFLRRPRWNRRSPTTTSRSWSYKPDDGGSHQAGGGGAGGGDIPTVVLTTPVVAFEPGAASPRTSPHPSSRSPARGRRDTEAVGGEEKGEEEAGDLSPSAHRTGNAQFFQVLSAKSVLQRFLKRRRHDRRPSTTSIRAWSFKQDGGSTSNSPVVAVEPGAPPPQHPHRRRSSATRGWGVSTQRLIQAMSSRHLVGPPEEAAVTQEPDGRSTSNSPLVALAPGAVPPQDSIRRLPSAAPGRGEGGATRRLSHVMSSRRLVSPVSEARRRVSLPSQAQVRASVTEVAAQGGEKSPSSAHQILEDFLAATMNPRLAWPSFWSCLDRLLELPPVELVTLLPLLKSYLKLPGLTDSKVATDLKPAAHRSLKRLITMLLLLLPLRGAEGGVEGGEGGVSQASVRTKSYAGGVEGGATTEGISGRGDDVRNRRYRTSDSIESAAAPVSPPGKSGSNRRVVILMDDAHYLDGESLRLLSLLLRSPSWPILVVMVSQTLELPHFSSLLSSVGRREPGPAPAPEAEGGVHTCAIHSHNHTHTHANSHAHAHPTTSVVELGPLSPSDVVDLSCAALKVSSIPPSITDYIYDKARGSPMYTLEFVAAIKRADLLVMEGEGKPCELNSDALLVHDLADADSVSSNTGVSTRSTPPKKRRFMRRRKRSSVSSTVSSVSSVSTASTSVSTATTTSSSSSSSTTTGTGAIYPTILVSTVPVIASPRTGTGKDTDRGAAVATAGLGGDLVSESLVPSGRRVTPPGSGEGSRTLQFDHGGDTSSQFGVRSDRADVPRSPSDLAPGPNLDPPQSSSGLILATPSITIGTSMAAAVESTASPSSSGLILASPSIPLRVAGQVLRAVTLFSSTSTSSAVVGGRRRRRPGQPRRTSLPSLPSDSPSPLDQVSASGRDEDGDGDGDGDGEFEEGKKGGRRFSSGRISYRLHTLIRGGSGRLRVHGNEMDEDGDGDGDGGGQESAIDGEEKDDGAAPPPSVSKRFSGRLRLSWKRGKKKKRSSSRHLPPLRSIPGQTTRLGMDMGLGLVSGSISGGLSEHEKEIENDNDLDSIGSHKELHSDVGGVPEPAHTGVFGSKGRILDNLKPRRLRRLIGAALQRVVVDMSGRGVVMSRVGLLESEAPELMWLLKVASVIGLSTNCAMWQDVVGRYAQWKGCEEERVGSFLEEWQKKRDSVRWAQLIFVSLPEGSPEVSGDGARVRHSARYLQDTSFYFRNEFVRQAFYNLMLPSQQMDLHAAVAQLLEAQPLKALTSQLPQLAHHWREAGRPDGVLLYCSEAGRLAQLNHRHEEALSWWTQGLEVCEEGGVTGVKVRAAALIGLAEAEASGGEWQAALCRVSQALELLEAGDLVALVEAEQQQQQQEEEEPERKPERSEDEKGPGVRAGAGALGLGPGIGGRKKKIQPMQLQKLAQQALAGVLPASLQGGEDGGSLRARMSGMLGDLAGCGWWGGAENNTLRDCVEMDVELGGGVGVKTVMPTLRSLILARALLLLAQILTSAALNDDLAVYAALRACLIAYGVGGGGGGGGGGIRNPSTKSASQDDHHPPSFLAMRHLQLECGLVVGTLLASRPHLFGTRLSAQSARLLTHIFEMSIDLPQLTLASPHNAGPASVLDVLTLGRDPEPDPEEMGVSIGGRKLSTGSSGVFGFGSTHLGLVSSPGVDGKKPSQKPGLKSDLGLTLMRGRPVGLATVMLEMGGLAVAKGHWGDALSFLWCAHDCALEEHLPVTSREVLVVAAFVFWLNGEKGESLYVLDMLQKELSEALNGEEEEPGDGHSGVKSDEASTESPSTTSKAPGLPFYSEMALLWAVLSMAPPNTSTSSTLRLEEDTSSVVYPLSAQVLTPPRSIKSGTGRMKHKSRSWGPSLIRGSGRKLYVHSHPSAHVAEGGDGSSASPRRVSAPAPHPASPATTPDVRASFTGSLNSHLASPSSIAGANASAVPASIDASESEVLGSRTGGREYAPMRGLDASTYVLGAVRDHVHRCAPFSSSRRDPARLQARRRSKTMGGSVTREGVKLERRSSNSRRGDSRGGGSGNHNRNCSCDGSSDSGSGSFRTRQVSAAARTSEPPRSPAREPGVSVEEDDAGRLQLQRSIDAAEAGLKAMWGKRDLFLFYAWAHLGQAVLMLWETRPEITWVPRLDRIMERLRSLARLLPVAQPRLLILEGWRKVVMGSRAEGVRQLRRALKTARKLGMPVEEELARERLLHPDGV